MLKPAALKIAVTGGSGFLGSHLLPFLLGEDFEVTCLSRRPDASFPAGARIVAGDCLDERSLAPFLAEQDVLLHMASVLFAPSWQSYLEANARGVRNLVNAIKSLPPEARPKKAVYISSLAAAGPCAVSPGLDESAAPAPVSAYGWSKLLGEKLFQEAFGDRTLILRPPIIYGSGDKGLLPMFKSAALGLGISPGSFRDFPVSVIHAGDVSRAILLLLQNGGSGVYHLNDGREHDMASFCRAMGAAQGKTVRTLRAPLPVMGASAALCSAWGNIAGKAAKISGRRPPRAPQWNLDKYREARQAGWLANAGRIRQEHGFIPEIDLKKGMAEAVRGYCKMGML